MNKENAIEVRDVKKTFKVYYDKGTQLKEKLLFWNRNKYERREVLRGISFDVKKGEVVGLIGHNGCGKSTTLKLLTRIIYPDSGSVEMKGRVSSLIELGAGFHPDMSGRENIYTNASIFGLSRKEIDNRIQDIIDFSEIEEFIDNPVRTYSSGMYMRLAFSVAINVDADILLIDEILGVGDAGFQTKCFNKLREIKQQGTTIVIVSHAMGQIEQICDRSIWIHEGLIKADGTPREVHPLYMDYMIEERKRIEEKELKKKRESGEIFEEDLVEANNGAANNMRWGNFYSKFKKVQLFDKEDKEITSFSTGDSVRIHAEYECRKTITDMVFGFGIYTLDDVWVYGSNTMIDRGENFVVEKDGSFDVILKDVPIMPGKYRIDVSLESASAVTVDFWRDTLEFTVYSIIDDRGIFRIEHDWKTQA